jgi:hypothetical protein
MGNRRGKGREGKGRYMILCYLSILLVYREFLVISSSQIIKTVNMSDE